MKKWIRCCSLLLSLLLCVTTLGGLLVAHAQEKNQISLYVQGTETAVTVNKGDVIAVRFNAGAPFSNLVLTPTRVFMNAGVSGMDMVLYSWNSSYETTLQGEPVAETSHGKFFAGDPCALDRDDEFPSGEYLLTITCTSGCWNLGAYQGQKKHTMWYVNGSLDTKSFAINLLSNANSYDFFEPLSEVEASGIQLNVQPNSWVMVDGLGRTLSQEVSKEVEQERYVGMFYWTSSGYWGQQTSAYNITERYHSLSAAEQLLVRNDYKADIWKTDKAPSWFWDEPLLGYYTANDDYVIRKHAELLADAGVDFIFFDCCVGLKTTASYMNVFEVFAKARSEGVNTPQIAFMLPMGDAKANAEYLRILYDHIYSKELYSDLWFIYEGKPLIMAYVDQLSKEGTDAEIRDFFTFRRGDAYSWRTEDFRNTDANTIYWGWLATYPQTRYLVPRRRNDPDRTVIEQMTVGVAQNVDVVNHVPTAMNGNNVAGRSYVFGDYSYSYRSGLTGQEVVVTPSIENSAMYGLNFQQQWDYAIEHDPNVLFVTGWNEWTVGRYQTFEGVSNAFPDQFDYEYSRDCEPSAGILKDYYYCQLVENIRRYKGIEDTQATVEDKSIDISSGADQWTDVFSYDHYVGSTWDRDAEGYGVTYKNDTMRNDIVRAKVAHDSEYVYFYVETAEALTSREDKAWMRLFLDTDSTGESPNWEGFEYIVNRINPADGKCTIERLTGSDDSGAWTYEAVGEAAYTVEGNILQIAIPRDAIGFADHEVNLNFKWSDNMQEDGNILDFYQNGDVAPGGRFCFRYLSCDVPQDPTQTETDEIPAESSSNAVSETAEEENSQTVSDDSQGCGSVTVLSPMVLVILLGAVVLRKRIKPLAMAFCTGNQNHKKIL